MEFNLKETLDRISKYVATYYSKDKETKKPFYNMYPYKPTKEELRQLKKSVKDIKII